MANIREKIREEKLMVRTDGEKDRGICSNENMEDGSGWPPKYSYTKTEVGR